MDDGQVGKDHRWSWARDMKTFDLSELETTDLGMRISNAIIIVRYSKSVMGI